MNQRAQVCPFCKALNGAADRRCYQCGRRLPSPMERAARDLVRSALGEQAPATVFFVGLCTLLFALTLLGAKFDVGQLLLGANKPVSEWLRWGALFSGVSFPSPLVIREPWRYLSAMFAHGSVLHVVMNMLALWSLGRRIEEGLGWARFTFIFILTGVLGFTVSDFWYALRSPVLVPTVGASGGLFGLAGAYIAYLYARRDPIYKDLLLQLVIFSVVIALYMPVNNAAHVGGFLTGAPMGYLFYKENRPWRHEFVFRPIALLCIVASVASVILCQTSSEWRIQRQMEIERGMELSRT